MERLIFARPGIVETPEIESTGTSRGGWMVTVFDNDFNTYDQVIFILMVATGCDEDEAYIETWEIDHLGQSVVHIADEPECRRVAGIIATIGIRVEVSEA
jgi:hypothetical protein